MTLKHYLRYFRLGRLLTSLKTAMSRPQRPQEVTKSPVGQPHFTPRESVLVWAVKAASNDSEPGVKVLLVVEDAKNKLVELELKRPPSGKFGCFEKKLHAKIYSPEDAAQNGLIPEDSIDAEASLYDVIYNRDIDCVYVKGKRYRIIKDPPDVLLNVEMKNKIGTTVMPHMKPDDFSKVREFVWFSGEPEGEHRLPPVYRDNDNKIQIFNWEEIHRGKFLDLLPEHEGKRIAVIADLGVDAIAKAYMLRSRIETPIESPFIFEERQNRYCSEEAPQGQYRIVTYNVLAHLYARPRKGKPLFFPYCTEEAIIDNTRYPILLKEIKGYKADLLFLQEVDKRFYDNYLKHFFEDLGFGSSFTEKGTSQGNGSTVPMREGVLVAYNKKKFAFEKEYKAQLSLYAQEDSNKDLMEIISGDKRITEKLLTRNNVVMAVALKELSSNKLVIAATTHLFFDPAFENIKILQAVMCSRFIGSIRRSFEGTQTRTIFGGDLNSTPNSAVVKFFREGSVTEDSECWENGEVRARFETTSQKYHSLCGFPEYTNFTEYTDKEGRPAGFKGCLDYILACQDVQTERVIPLPDEELVTRFTAIPSPIAASDHLALVCDVKIL